MPAAVKAQDAPRLRANVNALGARNNFPCVDSRKSKETCTWTAASTNVDAAGNKYHCPTRHYISTAADIAATRFHKCDAP